MGVPVIDLLLGAVAPSLILLNLSSQDALGALGAFLLAISLPATWGLIQALRRGRVSAVVILGFAGALVTGGIGLMQLDLFWFAVKDGSLYTLLGAWGVLLGHTPAGPLRVLLGTRGVIRTDEVLAAARERGPCTWATASA